MCICMCTNATLSICFAQSGRYTRPDSALRLKTLTYVGSFLSQHRNQHTRAQHINELLPAMRMRLARDISIKVANTLLCSVRLDVHCLKRLGAYSIQTHRRTYSRRDQTPHSHTIRDHMTGLCVVYVYALCEYCMWCLHRLAAKSHLRLIIQ